jgi:hypothetical protein
VNEVEWLACTAPQKMRQHLEESGFANERKLRLFAAACCRRVENWFIDSSQSAAVEVLERYADGLATANELAASGFALDALDEGDVNFASDRIDVDYNSVEAAFLTARAVAQASRIDPPGEGQPTYYHRLYDTIAYTVDTAGCAAVALDNENGRSLAAQLEEHRVLATLLRDVIGNPFRPVAFDPAWRTGTAVSLARMMYETREFSAMPILADALQDAGCESADVLGHCRGDSPHVRGCWVVDLVLGKSLSTAVVT